MQQSEEDRVLVEMLLFCSFLGNGVRCHITWSSAILRSEFRDWVKKRACQGIQMIRRGLWCQIMANYDQLTMTMTSSTQTVKHDIVSHNRLYGVFIEVWYFVCMLFIWMFLLLFGSVDYLIIPIICNHTQMKWCDNIFGWLISLQERVNASITDTHCLMDSIKSNQI